MKEMKTSKGDLTLHKPELRHQEQTAALRPRTGLWTPEFALQSQT